MTPEQAAHAAPQELQDMKGTADDVTPLRAEVAWFAEAMEVQLCANDHKSGWQDVSLLRLMVRLEQEAGELRRAIERGPGPHVAQWIIGEAADVANFAMMIADNVAREREADDA